MNDTKLFLSTLTEDQLTDMLRRVIHEEWQKRDEVDNDKFITAAEVAALSYPPISTQTVANWTRDGKLISYNNGGRKILYKKSEVLQSFKTIKRYSHANS